MSLSRHERRLMKREAFRQLPRKFFPGNRGRHEQRIKLHSESAFDKQREFRGSRRLFRLKLVLPRGPQLPS